MARPSKKPDSTNASHLGFEATLWATADKLRGNLDAAEYKHVVLGLIFLKYISDAFEEKHTALQNEKGADPEDRDEYLAENVFWVPPKHAGPTSKAAPKTRSSASCSTMP
jgi:type I restriction enzyme M protein